MKSIGDIIFGDKFKDPELIDELKSEFDNERNEVETFKGYHYTHKHCKIYGGYDSLELYLNQRINDDSNAEMFVHVTSSYCTLLEVCSAIKDNVFQAVGPIACLKNTMVINVFNEDVIPGYIEEKEIICPQITVAGQSLYVYDKKEYVENNPKFSIDGECLTKWDLKNNTTYSYLEGEILEAKTNEFIVGGQSYKVPYLVVDSDFGKLNVIYNDEDIEAIETQGGILQGKYVALVGLCFGDLNTRKRGRFVENKELYMIQVLYGAKKLKTVSYLSDLLSEDCIYESPRHRLYSKENILKLFQKIFDEGYSFKSYSTYLSFLNENEDIKFTNKPCIVDYYEGIYEGTMTIDLDQDGLISKIHYSNDILNYRDDNKYCFYNYKYFCKVMKDFFNGDPYDFMNRKAIVSYIEHSDNDYIRMLFNVIYKRVVLDKFSIDNIFDDNDLYSWLLRDAIVESLKKEYLNVYLSEVQYRTLINMFNEILTENYRYGGKIYDFLFGITVDAINQPEYTWKRWEHLVISLHHKLFGKKYTDVLKSYHIKQDTITMVYCKLHSKKTLKRLVKMLLKHRASEVNDYLVLKYAEQIRIRKNANVNSYFSNFDFDSHREKYLRLEDAIWTNKLYGCKEVIWNFAHNENLLDEVYIYIKTGSYKEYFRNLNNLSYWIDEEIQFLKLLEAEFIYKDEIEKMKKELSEMIDHNQYQIMDGYKDKVLNSLVIYDDVLVVYNEYKKYGRIKLNGKKYRP